MATTRARGDNIQTGRFVYGGRNGISNFCHITQEFLRLLLAINERKNFELRTWPSFGLNAPRRMAPIAIEHQSSILL